MCRACKPVAYFCQAAYFYLMHKLSAVAFFICLISFAHAQHSLSGIVRNSVQKPQEGAIVQLLTSSDSTLVKNEITGPEGNFQFSGVSSGSYFLLVTSDGPPVRNGPFEVSGDKTIEVSLPAQQTVQEVQVTTRKPYIERSKGKVVLNVEQSINAEGSSAYDILEKAPGVRIDNNDNVSLNGKPGTVIYVDGKPSPMTGAELANFLRGIGSANIEKIELISNPSSRFDAAGSSVINIRMKKDKRVGTNGNVTGFYGQGIYPKTGGGFSVNHRDKKLNVFTSYNYARREAFTNLQLDRQFSVNDTFRGAYVQDNMLKFAFTNHVVRAGVDYYANPRNTLGLVFTGVDNRFNPNGGNVSQVIDENRQLTSYFGTTNRSDERWNNFGINLNFNHVFDSLGSDLTTDLDFARYNNTSVQDFTTRYYDLFNAEYARPYLLHGDLGGQLDIYAIKNDLSKVFSNGLRIEGGQKSSYVVADNKVSFYDRSGGADVYDSTKSNHFVYNENINAGYLNVSRDIGKWSLQVGIRMEHTAVTGRQMVYDSTIRRNYSQLFPSGVISYKIREEHSLEMNFSRRIRRPGYQQLNPFKFYLDPTTYKEGNPYLLPEITASYELSHIYKQKITNTLSYARTGDNIVETIAPLADNSRITVQTMRNLARVDVYSYNLSVPVEIKKWWYTSTSFNLYYAAYTGNVASTPIRNRGNVTCSVNSSNTFSFGKSWSAEVTGFYNAREIYAYDIIRPRWFLNIGVQRKLWDNRGLLRLNVNDVFYTNNIRARVDYTGYTEHFLVKRDTRVVTLSFTWKFGKNTVPGARRRQGGAEDIKQRVGNGNG